jgi:signal transduction histidine kinase
MSDTNHDPRGERLLRALIDAAPYGAVLTRGNDVLYFNARAVDLLGYTLDDLPTMEAAFTKFYPDPVYREGVMQRWYSEQLSSTPAPEQVVRVRCKDGSDKQVSFAPPVSLPDGRQFTAFTDVTARELAVEELRKRDAVLEALAKSAHDFVVYRIRVEPEQPSLGFVEFVSDSIKEVFAVSDPMDRAAWLEHVHPDDLQNLTAANERSIRTGAKFDEEVRVRHPDGDSWRWVHAVANPVKDSRGQVTHFMGMLVDITAKKRALEERQELQRKVLRARELEALGTLASGIAHDFNNLLMAIGGCVSVALADGTADERLHQLLRYMADQVQHGAELTGQLLDSARSGSYEIKPIDLAATVRATTAAFERTERRLVVQQEIPDGPVMISGNRTQLDRVLLNLFVNAADAMQGEGVLRVELEPGVAPDSRLRDGRNGGEFTRVSIHDTGCGMSEDKVRRAFEPFFTTKPRGVGTGLGLSTVHSIVRAHGGHVDVDSRPGEGTVFHLYFPQRDVGTATSKLPADTVRGSGTILVVDDEPIVLFAVTKMLERLGFTVLAAESGARALEVYRARKPAIDLVLLDVIMPGMGGVEVYGKLKDLDSGVRVVLSSGHRADTVDMSAGQLAFLRKPYTLATLSQTVFHALAT